MHFPQFQIFSLQATENMAFTAARAAATAPKEARTAPPTRTTARGTTPTMTTDRAATMAPTHTTGTWRQQQRLPMRQERQYDRPYHGRRTAKAKQTVKT